MSADKPYKPDWRSASPKNLYPGDRVRFQAWDFREGVVLQPPRWVEHGNIELAIQTDSSYCGGVVKTILHNPDQPLLWDANWHHRDTFKEIPMTKKTDNHYSPITIETLLNIHTGVKRDYSHSAVPALQESIKRLLHDELITQVGGGGGYATFETTDRGRAHVTQLLDLPLPVEKKIWANAAGEVIA